MKLEAGARAVARSPRILGLFVWLLGLGCGGDSSDPLIPILSSPCPRPGAGVTVGGRHGEADTSVTPDRRVVLMGGGAEDDLAATRFVEGARGGDIVVLRATGSLTSYPDYFTLSLSPAADPASVVTVRTDVPASADDPAALCWVAGAEAIWLAGGDQWDYLGGWPSTLHAALRTAGERGIALGGTSAGAVSLGEAAFDARHGSVSSAEALAGPLRQEVSLSYPAFAAPELAGVLVDSHFMDRGREGRLLAFLARFLTEKSRSEVSGIGLDEGVALVIEGGLARIYGPADQSAWLYRVTGPAGVSSGEPLDLSGIRRVKLVEGAELPWPPDFETLLFTELAVVDGVVGIVQ